MASSDRYPSTRLRSACRLVALASLAFALPARGEDPGEAARALMHEALAERATMPARPPLMPERAAAQARELATSAKGDAVRGAPGATKQGAKDARTWRTDAANRAAAGAAMMHGPGTTHGGTPGPSASECNEAAGMMRTMGQDPRGGMMPGGGMSPGGGGMPGGGMPGGGMPGGGTSGGMPGHP